MGALSITVISSTDHPRFEQCADIRRVVFQIGQEVTREREVDGLDSDCVHFIADEGVQPVGTARYRIVSGWAKAERVAVLDRARRGGLGRALMSALEHHAREQGLKGVLLSSQEEAVPFYEKLHYRVVGEPYLDAGIPHRDMKKWF